MSSFNYNIVTIFLILCVLLTDTAPLPAHPAHKRLQKMENMVETVVESAAQEEESVNGIHEQIELPSSMGRQKIVDTVPFRTDSHDRHSHDMATEFDRLEDTLTTSTPFSPSTTAKPDLTQEVLITTVPSPEYEKLPTTPAKFSSIDSLVLTPSEKPRFDVLRTETYVETSSISAPSSTPSTVSETLLNSSEVDVNVPTATPTQEEAVKPVDSEPLTATALPEFLNRLTNLTLDVSQETGADEHHHKEHHHQEILISKHDHEIEVLGSSEPTEALVPPPTTEKSEVAEFTTVIPNVLLSTPSSAEIPKPTFPEDSMEQIIQTSPSPTEIIKSDLPKLRKFEPSRPPTRSQPTEPPTTKPFPLTTTMEIPEYTLIEKIIGGLRCSIRDCRGVLRPTQPSQKILKNATIIRKARYSCHCPTGAQLLEI